jgi:hypothetical protein
MTRASSPAVDDHQDHGQVLDVLAAAHPLNCTGRKTIVNLLKPDLGKLIYLALGLLVAPKVIAMVKG